MWMVDFVPKMVTSIVEHIKTHTNEKPHACKVCGKKFKNKGGATIHMSSHSQEKPFECEECGKKFTLKTNLNHHLKIHEGIKDFVCDICGQKFIFKNRLDHHMRMHRGEKDYVCKICGKGYSWKPSFIQHMKRHSIKLIRETEDSPENDKKNSLLHEQNTPVDFEFVECGATDSASEGGKCEDEKIRTGDGCDTFSHRLKSFKASHLPLKKRSGDLPPSTTPKRKVGSGAVRKTSPRTDNILKCEVMSDPAETGSTLKKKHPDLLKHVAIRTIQHRLQKDLGLPTRLTPKKPLLTEAMKKKRLNFCKKYEHWTSDDWKKVTFSDESTFRLVRGASKSVRRPKNVSRYSPKYTVKTVKHPDIVMVWGAFSGCEGRGDLYFLPKNVTMKGTNYIEVLRDHMLPFWPIHQCHKFMHDGAPAYKSKTVTKFLSDNEIDVLERPGNFPYLNQSKMLGT
ncbi:Gastrula zinc finger protein XlCGF57.1-like 4 [Homarus americanus]|uniref:Gastrula zinc finger protein XlCGF57.1-like 4 n=1 Tax=Homarus americanus TaxID=6706 RepID=A0A8J5MQL7_HOMAM|nr:Gastrula zinc finger protein XlCGF57.1-like 4 [Homarus americanus]